MKEKLTQWIQETVEALDIDVGTFVVEHPNEDGHGDYATNVALTTGGNPKEKAEQIAEALKGRLLSEVAEIAVAGPGFINITLADSYFLEKLKQIRNKGEEYGTNTTHTQRVMVEYTDPNPFKQFHIGHLMTNTIGEALARTLEASGATVVRANYQGDVGPHVAKALWGMQQLADEMPDDDASLDEKTTFLGRAYVAGAKAYEQGAREEIQGINKVVYEQSDEALMNLYERGRSWSLEHFEVLYEKLDTTFDYYFFERDVATAGMEVVRSFLAEGIFAESDGAVIYRGEQDGLHTRVFITTNGIPTYEAKEIGLTLKKFELEPELDRSVVVTAREQDEYMRVVRAAIGKIYPQLAEKMDHISHGMMSGLGGAKMSSRSGDVVTGESLLAEVEHLAYEKIQAADRVADPATLAEHVAVAAVKYMILKQSIGRDVIYDPKAILSFEGDSGPYLQYTYARAQSVLRKAAGEGSLEAPEATDDLIRQLAWYPEVVAESLEADFVPHKIIHYLTTLAQRYNTFYANNQIIGNEHQAYRLVITEATSQVLKNGMTLLGIPVVEQM